LILKLPLPFALVVNVSSTPLESLKTILALASDLPVKVPLVSVPLILTLLVSSVRNGVG